MVVDNDEFASSSRVVRLLPDNGGAPLEVDIDPNLVANGEHMRVEGTLVGNRLRPARITGRQQKPDPDCPTVGIQRAAVLLVYDAATPPPAKPPSEISDAVVAGGSFLGSSSLGRLKLEADVFGWRQLSGTYDFCAEFESMLDESLKAFARELRGGNYSRYFLVSPRKKACGWAGMSTLGCSALGSNGRTTGSASYLALDYFSTREQGMMLIAHESGHQFGLLHSEALRFSGEPLSSLSVWGTQDEYGDPFSAMGFWNGHQYPAPMKARLGWLSADSDYKVVEQTTSFSLGHFSASQSGLKALRIRRGSTGDKWLWVEYREGGALVHYERTDWPHSLLLDFMPSSHSMTDSAIRPGTTWSDPYSNLTIQIGAALPDALGVTIVYR